MSRATALSLAPLAGATVGAALLAFGSPRAQQVGAGLMIAYGAALAASATLGGVRFRSVRVGALVVPALVATQAAYVAGFLQGALRRP